MFDTSSSMVGRSRGQIKQTNEGTDMYGKRSSLFGSNVTVSYFRIIDIEVDYNIVLLTERCRLLCLCQSISTLTVSR